MLENHTCVLCLNLSQGSLNSAGQDAEYTQLWFASIAACLGMVRESATILRLRPD